MQIRHGDLLIEPVEAIPAGAQERADGVLAYGEATGHAHRLVGGAVLEHAGAVYARVTAPAEVVHEEHRTVTLPPGTYRVTRQREYDPYERAARRVLD